MIEIINIPDENFRQCILKKLDKPDDYEITKEDCEGITYINCCELGVESLEGIECFVNLKYLNCNKNQLTSLDVSKNNKLTKLHCSNNQLISLNIHENILLEPVLVNFSKKK